jgi:phosphomannomutase
VSTLSRVQPEHDHATTRATAERWLAAEPDDDMRAELQRLLDGPAEVLAERFAGRLQFGTAGLRAEVGAGPLRLNRLVARQAAAGLGEYLLDTVPDAAEAGVLIGYDARRKSDSCAADTARVLAAMGIKAYLFDQRVATPIVSWGVTEVGAAAGVVVTASHNPPADNGYKVFLGDGSQIVSPHDALISERIDRFDATAVTLADAADPLIVPVGDPLIDAYVAAVPAVRRRPDVAGVRVAYTALHGVAGALVERAFAAAGLAAPAVVVEQHEPDGTFPTVPFPNPEEPGAMDLLMQLAADMGAAVALANDPDGDRLGAAIPQPDGAWRRLGGDEIGWLLADHILSCGDDESDAANRLVVTTLVSSGLLTKMAEAHGVESCETFTGFKWIAHEIRRRPERRFVFGYEQALGYLVTARPRDKDGVTAAVLFAEIAAVAESQGITLQEWLDSIAERFGRHVLADRSVRMEPAAGAAAVDVLRAAPPAELGGRAVVSVEEYPEANLLRLELEGGVRVQVRPSGTEPKVKLYGEAVGEDPAPYLDALAALLA